MRVKSHFVGLTFYFLVGNKSDDGYFSSKAKYASLFISEAFPGYFQAMISSERMVSQIKRIYFLSLTFDGYSLKKRQYKCLKHDKLREYYLHTYFDVLLLPNCILAMLVELSFNSGVKQNNSQAHSL